MGLLDVLLLPVTIPFRVVEHTADAFLGPDEDLPPPRKRTISNSSIVRSYLPADAIEMLNSIEAEGGEITPEMSEFIVNHPEIQKRGLTRADIKRFLRLGGWPKTAANL
jgi:hypothetical protein